VAGPLQVPKLAISFGGNMADGVDSADFPQL
jgi:hypothetical protein